MLLAARRLAARHFSAAAAPVPLKATLFPGDGVGPEISDAVSLVLKTAGVPVDWDVQVVNHDKPDPRTNSFITRENLDSVKARARGGGCQKGAVGCASSASPPSPGPAAAQQSRSAPRQAAGRRRR